MRAARRVTIQSWPRKMTAKTTAIRTTAVSMRFISLYQDNACPAGRARSARGGHFVTGNGLRVVLPVVANEVWVGNAALVVRLQRRWAVPKCCRGGENCGSEVEEKS